MFVRFRHLLIGFIVVFPLIASACQSAATPEPGAAQPSGPAPAPALTTDTPIVAIATGELQGVREHGVFVFKGIPYAAPPVGVLRWHEPQPPLSWQGVRPADAFGHACIQPVADTLEGAGDVGPQSEDCLFLNVWTPDPRPDAHLPVMVWIHGGGLVIGSGGLPVFTGAPLAQRGVVMVTFNYRLGPLGFFAHPSLLQNDPDGPINFGLLDQIAALKWVQQNIAAFGGDPDNVTIFGQSAGAQSVLALFASPQARGLFQKGVAQSAYGVPGNTRSRAKDASILVAEAVGLDGANASAEALRAVPAEAFGTISNPFASLAPSFVIGDSVLPKSIFNVFKAKQEAPVPLIIGSNSDEASVAQALGIDPGMLMEQLVSIKPLLKLFYFGVNENSELGRQVIRDLIFTSFAKRIADWHARKAPTWRYYFSYVPVNLRDEKPGVGHGDEMAFVLDTMDFVSHPENYIQADRDMAKQVSSYWLAFAQTDTPHPQDEPTWPRDTVHRDRVMEFGDSIVVHSHFMGARLKLYIWLVNLLRWLTGAA